MDIQKYLYLGRVSLQFSVKMYVDFRDARTNRTFQAHLFAIQSKLIFLDDYVKLLIKI